jgi:hypothetical protein
VTRELLLAVTEVMVMHEVAVVGEQDDESLEDGATLCNAIVD